MKYTCHQLFIKTPHRQYIKFFLLCLLCLAYLFGLLVDIQGDAAKYAAIGRVLVEGGDWLAIQERFGGAYLQKPPFLFWLVGSSFSLFGISNFSFKLFPFLFTLLGGYFTYCFAHSFYSKTIARLSLLIFFTVEATFIYSNDVRTDTVLMPLVIASIWQLLLFCKNNSSKHILYGSVALAFALLTKGPLAIALVLIAMATHIVLKKNWIVILRWQWLLVFIIPSAILLPYLYTLYRQFGLDGIIFFFWKNNVGRITGSYLKNYSDPFFYVHNLLWVFFPWSFFFLIAYVRQCIALYKTRFFITKHPKSKAVFTTISEGGSIGVLTIFLLILSIASFKSPNYLYVLTPFVSLMTAISLVDIYNTGNIFGWKVSRSSCKAFISIVVLFMALLNMFLSLWVFPYVFRHHRYRQASKIIAESKYSHLPLYVYHDKQSLVSPTLKFYLDKQVIHISSLDQLNTLEGSWLLIAKEDFQQIEGLDVKAKVKHTHELIHYKTKNSLPIALFFTDNDKKKLEKYFLVALW